MAYAFDSDNYDNYTKPSREYGVLGANYNQQLVPLITDSPYLTKLGGMGIQYQAADPNAAMDNGYWTLMKQNNGQPYATIAGYGYPKDCSYYNIIQCPTNKVLSRFPEIPMGSSTDVTAPPVGSTCNPSEAKTMSVTDLIHFMNRNHFIVYADAGTASQVLQVFPDMLRQYLSFVDISTDAGKADMQSRGITTVPTIVSAATPGIMYSGVPPSFTAFQLFWLKAADMPAANMNVTSVPQPPALNNQAKYVVVVSAGCPYSQTLKNDILQNTSYSALTQLIDNTDAGQLQAYLGPAVQQITAYPFIINLASGKSMVGYNANLGLVSLYNSLQ